MLINITGAGDKRALKVSDGEEVLFEAKGVTLSDAHKLAKAGLKDGWDSLKAKK